VEVMKATEMMETEAVEVVQAETAMDWTLIQSTQGE
jgi:hypothetical protein